MRASILQHSLEHHTTLHSSFAGELPPQIRPSPMTQLNEDPEVNSGNQVEKAAEDLLGQQAGKAALETAMKGPAQQDAALQEPGQAVSQPTRSQLTQQVRDQMQSLLSQRKVEPKCTPARPVPQPQPHSVTGATPLFNSPQIPLCAQSNLGECPYFVDTLGRTRKKSEYIEPEYHEPMKTLHYPKQDFKDDEQEDEEAEVDIDEESMGSAAWPFNQTLLAMLRPAPPLVVAPGCLPVAHRKCVGRASAMQCSRQQRRHAHGYAFL
jgi:hypothetical protein